MANYLVTGGAGFIGSHLAKRLLKDGHKVFIFDNLSAGNVSNIPQGAIRVGAIGEARPCDAVFHLAAQCSQAISFDNPRLDMYSNQMLTLDLLDWCKKNGTKRFIYTSSMVIYGHAAGNGPSEYSVCRPTSYYGVHKLASEGYIRLSDLDYTIFRLQTVYGPGQNLANRRQGIISIFLSMMLSNEPVVVKGSLARYRDFIYVDDVVDAMTKSLHAGPAYCQTYNLGTGIATTLRELLALLAELADYKGKIEEGQGSTQGDHHGAIANISKIYRDLNWSPKVTLKEGARRFVEDSRARL